MHAVGCLLPFRQTQWAFWFFSPPNRRWGVCPFRMDFAENPTDRILHAFQVWVLAGRLWVLHRLRVAGAARLITAAL